MADTITIRTSTERDVVKIVERGPQGPAGGGGGGGSGTVTSVALAGTGLSITGSPVTASGTITANVSYGTTAGTACEGNDGRIAGIESGAISAEGASITAASAGFQVITGNGTGQINTSDGGSIDTSNGGGSINTRGTGSIEFGEVGTRTTLTGTATADRAISLPNAAGTVALTSDITKTAVGLGNVPNVDTTNAANISSGVLPNARVNFAAPSAIGSTTANSGAFTTLSAAPTSGSALTLTGGTVTASAPLIDATQTWNNAAVTFTGLRLNATNTASATASLLMDLQTGGTTQFSVRRDGVVNAGLYYRFTGLNSGLFVHSAGGGIISIGANPDNWMTLSNSRMQLTGDLSLGRALSAGQAADTILARDAANTLAQVNGTNAQESRLYGTFTSSTNYQRMTIKSVRQTLSALSGASATTTGTFIPDGAVVVGVTTRVATAITGASGYLVGDGTDSDRWGDITGTAIGTTSDNINWTAGTIECFTAGGNVTLTAKTSNFTAGAVEICVFYLAGEAD